MHRMAIFILMGHIRKTAGGERGSGRCRRGYQQRRTRDGRRRAAQLIGRKTHRHKGKQHQRLSLQRIAYGNRHSAHRVDTIFLKITILYLRPRPFSAIKASRVAPPSMLRTHPQSILTFPAGTTFRMLAVLSFTQ